MNKEEEAKILKDWEGVNEQSVAFYAPSEEEDQVYVFIGDVDCQTKKRFLATKTLGDFVFRKVKMITFGAICEHCGKKTKVVLIWDKKDPDLEKNRKYAEKLAKRIVAETMTA